MIANMWRTSHERFLRAIRVFIFVTFVAVVIATLAECQPITHYWQVVPDPGPHCRQGYLQLITMGTADIITDILLIIFPLVVVIQSHFPWKRKVSLVLLFSMSITLVVITALRIPYVIAHKSLQQYRTVWASVEILAASAISNAIQLGSFLRDRGVKKARYRPERVLSRTESNQAPSTRRPTLTQHHYGSDEDLFRDVGCRVQTGDDVEAARPRTAKTVASPSETDEFPMKDSANWHFPESAPADSSHDSEDNEDIRDTISVDPMPSPTDVRGHPRERRVSFYDVGGLLDEADSRSSIVPISPTSSTSKGSRHIMADLLTTLSPTHRPLSNLSTHSLPPRSPSSRSPEPPRSILRRYDSNAPPLQDVGGLAPPRDAGNSMELQDIGGLLPPSNAGDELLDVGGLLSPPPRERIDSYLSPAPPAPPQASHFQLPRPLDIPRSISQASSSSSR